LWQGDIIIQKDKIKSFEAILKRMLSDDHNDVLNSLNDELKQAISFD
jgi:hypothetical protein